MRLVDLTMLELTELLPSQRGLIETVSPLASFFGHAAKGRPRRPRVEVLRESPTVGNTMQLEVRVDELLEKGLVPVKSDQHLLTLLANASPWKDWRAVRESPSRLTTLWATWAPKAVLDELIGSVTQVMVSLDTLFVRTARRSFECALPLEVADTLSAPRALRPLLAVHARIAALRIYGGGSNLPTQAFELGWTAQGFVGTSASLVASRLLSEANAR